MQNGNYSLSNGSKEFYLRIFNSFRAFSLFEWNNVTEFFKKLRYTRTTIRQVEVY